LSGTSKMHMKVYQNLTLVVNFQNSKRKKKDSRKPPTNTFIWPHLLFASYFHNLHNILLCLQESLWAEQTKHVQPITLCTLMMLVKKRVRKEKE